MKKFLFLCFGWLGIVAETQAQQVSSVPVGVQLCGTQPIVIERLPFNSGSKVLKTTPCAKDFPERHAQWLQWQAATAGEVAFALHPLVESDDLDFVLLRQVGDTWEIIRCMAAGNSDGNSAACLGATGLATFAEGSQETSGCLQAQDNFLAPIEAQKGDKFALLVSNYRSERGFWLEYLGTAIPSALFSNENAMTRSELVEKANIFTTLHHPSIELRSLNAIRNRVRLSDFRQALQPAFLQQNSYVAGCVNQQKATQTAASFLGNPQPNPTKGAFVLPIYLAGSALLDIRISQSDAREVFSQQLDAPTGETLLSINSSDWQAGQYIITVKCEGQLLSKTLIKL
jgi:hypothetical protein